MSSENSSRRRVVITGLGIISPIGNSWQTFWQSLLEGKSGVAPLTTLPGQVYPMSFAGEVRDFTGHIDDFGELSPEPKKAVKKGLRLMCRETQMGVAAAQRALSDAKFAAAPFDPERSGVSFGAGYMVTAPEEISDGIRRCSNAAQEFEYPRWGGEGMKQINPLWLLRYLPNMPACHIAIYNDLRGPNNSLTHGEAAANLAIGEAFHVIARGSADLMIAGATGTRVNPMRTIQAVLQDEVAPNGPEPQRASRPFDRNRTGMVLGEGSAVLILEELTAARNRGATIYGEIAGAGSSCVADRNHLGRREAALTNAMRAALRQADTSPVDVGFVHAHGLSTRSGDIEEARAIHAVFGAAAERLPVVASKSNFGNLGAGSGAVELVAGVLALHHGRLFPTLNYETPDPDCRLSVVTHDRPAGGSFLSLSVNQRGQASCVFVKACV